LGFIIRFYATLSRGCVVKMQVKLVQLGWDFHDHWSIPSPRPSVATATASSAT